MADPIPAPSPEPTPAAAPRKHGVINKKQQQSLVLAEQVCTAAAKDDYAATLETGHDIDPGFIAALAADCGTARTGLGQVVENAVAKSVATGGKTGTKKNLMRAVRQIQTAAKQKYTTTQPVMLKDYYVGQKIDANQNTLEQVGTAILGKISPPAEGAVRGGASPSATDILPGITAGKIAALSDAVDAFKNAWGAQVTAQSDQVKGRISLVSLVKSIDDRRRIVQYAADGEWTFDNPANAPIRREFGLPTNRPFIATVKNSRAQSAPALPAAVKRKAVKKAAKTKKAGKGPKSKTQRSRK